MSAESRTPSVPHPQDKVYLAGMWFDACGCSEKCGDDGDHEGPGVCRGLPLPPRPPLVEIVLVPRR